MQFLLDGEDLWEIVNQDTATATATASDPQASRTQTRNRTRTLSQAPTTSEADSRKTKKAAYLIYQSCTAAPQSHIAHEKNPAKMWSILADLSSRVNDDDEAGQALFEEFWMEQFQKYKSIDEYAAKLRTYQDQLANASDMQLSDNKLIITKLHS